MCLRMFRSMHEPKNLLTDRHKTCMISNRAFRLKIKKEYAEEEMKV